MIQLYGLKNCDTCRKAMTQLKVAEIAYNFIDIREEANLEVELPDWLAQIGADRLINKRSTTWRELSTDDRTKALAGDIGLIAAHPTLVKRPVIVSSENMMVGLNASDWSRIVGGVGV